MLTQMIHRDWNRASVIIWSIGNETPFTDARMDFMIDLKETAEGLDSSRLISAALLSGSVEQFRSLTYFLAKEGLRHSFVSDYEKVIFKQIVSQLRDYLFKNNLFIVAHKTMPKSFFSKKVG